MAYTLQETAELVFRQLFPNPSDETSITLEEFIATAKSEYAYTIWTLNRKELQETGENNVPPILLSTEELVIEDKIADISEISALRSLQGNSWIQFIGTLGECSYVVMDLNKYKLLQDDESRNETKAAVILGSQIYFPDGVYKSKEQIIFANTGENLDNRTPIDGAVAGVLRRSLFDIYSKKVAEDKTNNSNSDE